MIWLWRNISTNSQDELYSLETFLYQASQSKPTPKSTQQTSSHESEALHTEFSITHNGSARLFLAILHSRNQLLAKPTKGKSPKRLLPTQQLQNQSKPSCDHRIFVRKPPWHYILLLFTLEEISQSIKAKMTSQNYLQFPRKQNKTFALIQKHKQTTSSFYISNLNNPPVFFFQAMHHWFLFLLDEPLPIIIHLEKCYSISMKRYRLTLPYLS